MNALPAIVVSALVAISAASTGVAQQREPAQRALEALLADPAFAGARVGVMVRDLANGETLCQHDAEMGFMTASNMKLVASSTALVTLGPDYRFATTLIGSRAVDDGVLDGDLVLAGSGDPSFGGWHDGNRPVEQMRSLARRLVEAHGLKRITGDVIGDDDCQPDEIMGEGWSWGYQGDAYAAQVSGLCFAENIAIAYASGTQPGTLAAVEIVPQTDYLSVAKTMVTGEANATARIWSSRARGSNRVTIGGVAAPSTKRLRERFSVENPTHYASTALLEALIAEGVQVDGAAVDGDTLKPRGERYGDEVVLLTHKSAPLSTLLRRLNKISQNLYAEQLIRAASRSAVSKAGMRAAAAHAKLTLGTLGVDTAGMRIADGSGLTRLNLVKPRQFVDLLDGMWKHEHRDPFVDSLPVAGVDGTLRRRFRGQTDVGDIRAKTGYISSVVALSGYVLRGESKPVVFSILINNFTTPTRGIQDAVDRFAGALIRR